MLYKKLLGILLFLMLCLGGVYGVEYVTETFNNPVVNVGGTDYSLEATNPSFAESSSEQYCIEQGYEEYSSYTASATSSVGTYTYWTGSTWTLLTADRKSITQIICRTEYKFDSVSANLDTSFNNSYFDTNNITFQVNTSLNSSNIFYRLLDTPATSFNDGTMTGFSRNDGTVSGGVTIEDDKIIFPGTTSSDRLNLPSGLLNGSNSFTLQVKFTENIITDNNRGLVSFGNRQLWMFVGVAGSKTMTIQIQDNLSNTVSKNIDYSLVSNPIISIVYNGSQIRYFLNETEFIPNNFVGPLKDSTSDFLGIISGFNSWVGSIDYFRLWKNTALTEEELFNEFNSDYAVKSDGLVAQYSGKDFAGTADSPTTIYDTNMISRGQTASYNNITSQAINFDGVDDYVETSSSILLNNTYSILFFGNIKNDDFISSIFGDSSSTFGYIWYDGRSSGRFAFEPSSIDGNACIIDYPKINLDGSFKHYSFIFNNSKLSLYVDGVFVDECNLLGGISDLNIEYIGRGYTGVSGAFFNGSIDQVKIYNRSLTQEEITALYTGSAPVLNGLVWEQGYIDIENNQVKDRVKRICTNCITTNLNIYNLSEETYNILFTANNGDTNITTDYYYFTVDLTNPIINNNIPAELNSYEFNNSLFNCTDTNLKLCQITIQNQTYNSTQNFNATFNGNFTYTLYAEDEAGNNQTDIGNILINPYQYIYFQDVNSTMITNFDLDGTTYVNYAEIKLYDYGIGEHNLLFEKFGYNSGNITLTFNTTSAINVTYTIPFAKLIFTFQDVTDSSYIESGNDTTIQIIGDDYSDTFTTTNRNYTLIDSDIVAGTYNVIVSNLNYETVNTLFTFNNQEQLDINIFMTPIDIVEESIADLLVQVQDLDGNVIGGVLTYQYIWESSILQDLLINQKVTDYSGETSYKVILDTRLYKFCAEYNDNLFCNDRVTININTDRVIIPIDTTKFEETTASNIYNVNFVYSLDNVTVGNQSTVSFTWNNPSQDVDNYCLQVYKLVDGVETLLTPNGKQCSTLHSNGLSLLINFENDTIYIAKAIIEQDGEYRILKVLTLNENYELFGFLEDFGLHKIVAVILVFLALGIGLHPKVHQVTISHLALPISYLIISIIFPVLLSLDIFIIVLVVNLATIRLITKRDDVGQTPQINVLISIVIVYILMIFTTVAILNDFDDRDMLDDYGTDLLNYLDGGSDSVNNKLQTFVEDSTTELNSTKEGTSPGGEDKIDNTLTFFIKSLGWVNTFFTIMSKIFAIPQTIYYMLGFSTTYLTNLFFYINWIVNIVIMRAFYKALFK